MAGWTEEDKKKHQWKNDYTAHESSPRVRKRGEEGSDANKLRGELYKYAFERFRDWNALQVANNKKRFAFEIISLADSMMNDRIQAILQTLKHDESLQWKAMSSRTALDILDSKILEKELIISPKFQDLLKQFSDWILDRNQSLHEFLIVNNGNQRLDMEKRVKTVLDTAEWATELARDLADESAKVIKKLKKDD